MEEGGKEKTVYLPGDWSALTTEWSLTSNTQPVSPVQVRRTLKVIFFQETKLSVPSLLGSYNDCQTSEIVQEKPDAFLVKTNKIKV